MLFARPPSRVALGGLYVLVCLSLMYKFYRYLLQLRSRVSAAAHGVVRFGFCTARSMRTCKIWSSLKLILKTTVRETTSHTLFWSQVAFCAKVPSRSPRYLFLYRPSLSASFVRKSTNSVANFGPRDNWAQCTSPAMPPVVLFFCFYSPALSFLPFFHNIGHLPTFDSPSVPSHATLAAQGAAICR